MWHWVKIFPITSVVAVSFHNGSLVNTLFQSKKNSRSLETFPIFFSEIWKDEKGKAFFVYGVAEERKTRTNLRTF
jgi:hypothetical protein